MLRVLVKVLCGMMKVLCGMMNKLNRIRITRWATANYDKNYGAHFVQFWDAEDFEEYKSLKDFIESYAEPAQDYYDNEMHKIEDFIF